jgi:predicted transcriptional regulator
MSYQNLQILNALREGPRTTEELVIRLKVMSVTKRISELRKLGYRITSTQRTLGRMKIFTYRLEDDAK